MAYEMRTEGGLLKIVFSGTFTNGDMSRAAVEVAEFEDSSDIAPHRSADLRPVNRLEIDFAGVFTITEARRRRHLKNPIKTAIIASDIVQFGFARMFQTLNDHPLIVIAIFGDDESAVQWLQLSDVRPPAVAWQPRLS